MGKLILITASLLISIGTYAEKPINLGDYIVENQELYLECGTSWNDRPIWIWVGLTSESVSVWFHRKPMSRIGMTAYKFDESFISFCKRYLGEAKIFCDGSEFTLNRMDGTLDAYGDNIPCTQYSMDEFNNRKKKFYDWIVKERKF